VVEIGDDSIVPSTPTLQLPHRTDGFAEAVSSPHVNERFMFVPSSDVIPQSELAHQGGVDVTRMDLSQFDPVAAAMIASGVRRSLNTSTSQSQVPTPSISITEATPPISARDDLEDLLALREEADRAEEQDSGSLLEPFHSYSEADLTSAEVSRSQTPEPDEPLSQDDQAGQDDGSDPLMSGSTEHEDRPSTSEGVGSGRGDFQAPKKPKIQKIVWKEPEQEGSTSSASGMPSTASGSTGLRRGFRRGGTRDAGRPYGIAGVRGGSVRPLLPGGPGLVQADPAGLQQMQAQQVRGSPMGMARRARGGRTGGNQVWSNRQQQHF